MLLNHVILEPPCLIMYYFLFVLDLLKFPLKAHTKKTTAHTQQKNPPKKMPPRSKKTTHPPKNAATRRFVSVKLLSVQDLVKIAQELKFEGPSIRGFWRVQDRGASRAGRERNESSRVDVVESGRCGNCHAVFGKINEYVCKRDAKKTNVFFWFQD